MKQENWMCELCYPGSSTISKIAKGVYLCIYENRYHIVGGQGHEGDIIYTFNTTPCFLGENEEEISKNEELYNQFEIACRDLEENPLKMDPFEAWRLVDACIKSSLYDPERDGYNFTLWLFSYCGNLIKKESK